MIDRTLCQMEIDPKLIELRRQRAEWSAKYGPLMANIYPHGRGMDMQAMQDNHSYLMCLLGGLLP